MADKINSNDSEVQLQTQKEEAQLGAKQDCVTCVLAERFTNFTVNLIRFCFCISVGLILATHTSQDNYQQISNGIIASSQILLNKSLRGVFPPLEGTVGSLMGKWKMSLVTEMQGTSDRYHDYTLNFKTNGQVEITNKKCRGDLKYKWEVFYYNIAIQDLPNDQKNVDMQIPNQQQDVKCIEGDGQLMQILKGASIYTVHSSNLYMVLEIGLESERVTRMLIFEKQ